MFASCLGLIAPSGASVHVAVVQNVRRGISSPRATPFAQQSGRTEKGCASQ